jgi:FtsH-binding integral membrane protein
MFSSNVFERSGSDSMTRGAFFLVIGAILAWGFGLTVIVSDLTATWVPANIWVFLGVGLGLPLVGVLLSATPNAFLSFIGFNMVAGGLAAILGPVLAHYRVSDPGLITETAMLTGLVTGVMAVSGLLFPKFYESIGGALFGALLALLAVSVAGFFIPELANMTWIHYVAAGIFALYIGFDMYRASSIPATLDNAVDVSTALYLDIINLFIRLLAARRS